MSSPAQVIVGSSSGFAVAASSTPSLAAALHSNRMEQDQIVRVRGRNKCFWTENEVQVLIVTLQDMACDPSWKTDGGFKSNYMAEVHKRMLSKIPTLTKQVTPHIESKIKWLKTRFHIINDMCRQSGCQWNDVEEKNSMLKAMV
ncbi:uncharacterized protein LOC122048932 [Zingiber officinale]|uniref:uncharacterized protein LOC122048932 n=1 Tax=Zingiber officinale TaxID=94328 RepID=UPI001C4C027F|nr:uncharacterized protein LOC122048932 [Zingiber officinale]